MLLALMTILCPWACTLGTLPLLPNSNGYNMIMAMSYHIFHMMFLIQMHLQILPVPLMLELQTVMNLQNLIVTSWWSYCPVCHYGGYHGPNSFWKEIVDVKPSCTISDPGLEPVNSDFIVILQMLHMFMDKCITPGYSHGKSFFSNGNISPMQFKLHHQLFEALESAIVDNDDIPGSATSSTDPFLFELWPLTKEKFQGELLALKSTHHIPPLLAYDLTGDLLRPSTYQCCLQGALVEVHFTLSHWPIASLKHNVYVVQIQLIQLLAPPVVSLATGKKRKIPLHLDIDECPLKKTASF
ncbi:hypothetical protein EDC04DRAFT_2600031 [Pisolithus marmoratus]|nr:hypothetical protein EDC04DRAFT_2600031 [Pisolithus marmoratus]